MSQFQFLLHDGHLDTEAVENALDAADIDGVDHVNYTDGNGRQRGWFAGPNRGHPFDANLKKVVEAALAAEGGIDAFRVQDEDDDEE